MRFGKRYGFAQAILAVYEKKVRQSLPAVLRSRGIQTLSAEDVIGPSTQVSDNIHKTFQVPKVEESS